MALDPAWNLPLQRIDNFLTDFLFIKKIKLLKKSPDG